MLDTPVLGILMEAEEVRKHRNCWFCQERDLDSAESVLHDQ